MLFYEDFTDKIDDLFDKDYAYKFPFAVKVDTKDHYFMNYAHKSFFIAKPVGIGLDNECKFRYARENKAGSFLISTDKLELQLEYEPKPFSTVDRFLAFKARSAILPRLSLLQPAEKKYVLDFENELETRMSFRPELGHTVKLLHDGLHTFPRVGLSTLYNQKPLLFGFDYIFDKDIKNMSGPFEVLFGFSPYTGILTYLKHRVTQFEYPGKIGAGVYIQRVFESTCDKKTKKGVVKKTCLWPTEFAAEGFVDMMRANLLEGRTGVRLGYGKRHELKAKLDSDLKFATAFSYRPKKGLKFIWSNQLDLRKLFNDPRNGVDYMGGFSLELDFGPSF